MIIFYTFFIRIAVISFSFVTFAPELYIDDEIRFYTSTCEVGLMAKADQSLQDVSKAIWRSVDGIRQAVRHRSGDRLSEDQQYHDDEAMRHPYAEVSKYADSRKQAYQFQSEKSGGSSQPTCHPFHRGKRPDSCHPLSQSTSTDCR